MNRESQQTGSMRCYNKYVYQVAQKLAFHRVATQVVNVYRSKLRNDLAGPQGDEVARQRVEAYANRIRPAGFLVRPRSPF